jgi:hypothetical protein
VLGLVVLVAAAPVPGEVPGDDHLGGAVAVLGQQDRGAGDEALFVALLVDVVDVAGAAGVVVGAACELGACERVGEVLAGRDEGEVPVEVAVLYLI